MIQANELRIGNWVLNKRYKSGYKMQIESIGEFGLNVEVGYDGLNPIIDDDCGFNECEPIPLTEEWLLKFGFEIHEDGYITCSNGYQWILHLDNEFEFEALKIIVLYVHQLQNLYFALTNEELTFKP